MIDFGLVAAAKKAVTAKPRQHVTPAILCAVAIQESSGVPYFIDTKPGSLWSLNLRDAKRHTGFTERQIRDMITIPLKIGKYVPPRIMQGQLAKFRFEPGYWNKYAHLARTDRFYYSCSWGLCQFMGPNISKDPDTKGIEFIKEFMANTDLQLLYGAGMLEELLDTNHGDLFKSYCEYNSGDPNCKAPAVIRRAKDVVEKAREVQLFIREREGLTHV